MAGKRNPCKFWPKGLCKMGNNCSFEHVGAGSSPSPAPSSSKNSFKTPEQELNQWSNDIVVDLRDERPLYELSSFSLPNQGCLIAGMDISPNELRLMAYEARNNNTMPQFEAEVRNKQARMKQYVDFVLQDTRKAARYLQMAQKSTTGAIKPYAPPGFSTSLVTAGNSDSSIGGGMFGNSNINSNSNSNPFGSTGSTGNAFGSCGFGSQPTSNPFGSTSTFGTSAFGAAPATSAFGAAPATSAFGAAPATSAFGAAPATSAFGAAPATSAFGAAPATSAFGAAPASSPFGSLSQGSAGTPAFGSSTFGSAGSNTFGSSTFGSKFATPAAPSAFGSFGAAPATTFGSSTFGSSPAAGLGSSAFDSLGGTSAFGSSGFGNTPAPSTGFGSFGQPPATATTTVTATTAPTAPTTTTTAFGQSSFGSFGSATPSTSAFGSTLVPANVPATPFGASSFGNPQTPSPFGNVAFAPEATATTAAPAVQNPSMLPSNSNYPLPLNANFTVLFQGKNGEPQPRLADIQPKFAAAFGALKFAIGQVPDCVPPMELR